MAWRVRRAEPDTRAVSKPDPIRFAMTLTDMEALTVRDNLLALREELEESTEISQGAIDGFDAVLEILGVKYGR